jgi:hypothetical protein
MAFLPRSLIEFAVRIVVATLALLDTAPPLALIAFFVSQVKNTISVSQSVRHLA